MRGGDAVISGPVLLCKAQELSEQLKEEFVPNRSWLQRWCKKNAISYSKLHGESKSSNTADASSFIENRVPKLLEKFSPDCIFNADETGLYYKALPDGTFKGKHEEAKGWKTQKQRLTLLFVVNATGTYKRAYCIGKPQKPRCFKGKDIPLPYYSNRNAWMTTVIWNSILTDFNKNLQKENKKIVLIVDNASCHKTHLTFSNIDVEFLPPNTTSIIQPLDQGIIHSFKAEYRKVLIKKQLLALEKAIGVTNFLKSISILDALSYSKHALNSIKPQTIENCFKKVGMV